MRGEREILRRCAALLSAGRAAEARRLMLQIAKDLFGAAAAALWGRDETNENFVDLTGSAAETAAIPCEQCEKRNLPLYWAFQQMRAFCLPRDDILLLRRLKQELFPSRRETGFILLPCIYEGNNYADSLFMIVCPAQNITEAALAAGGDFAVFCAAFMRMRNGFDRIDFRGRYMAQALEANARRQKENEARGAEMLQSRLIGSSAKMAQARRNILKYAPSSLSVLIIGETGTGKELAAQSLHQASSRRSGKFVPVNMAALPENLVESELFGFVRGAFTGADKNHAGLFAEAQDGTLFLDEIGDLPPGLQAKILRVLQEKKYRPLGANRELPCNARIIAATHKNIEELIAAGKFRADLYYRIAEGKIILPPLRERAADISELADYFLAQISIAEGGEFTLSENARLYLLRQVFPGNIRQLRSVLRDAALSAGADFVLHLAAVQEAYESSSFAAAAADPRAIVLTQGLAQGLEAFEKMVLLDALAQNQQQRKKTAQKLQIPLRTFYNKLRKYGLEGEDNALFD